MTRLNAILLTVALTLFLHCLGRVFGTWLVMYVAGSFCVALFIGAVIALGEDADWARDHD